MKKILLLICLALMTACANNSRPDLQRLYQSAVKDTSQKTPVVLLHGIMGSKLRKKDSLEEIWFGSLRKLLFSNYKNVALNIDANSSVLRSEDLESFDIADKAAGTDYYQAIIRTLQQYGGYQFADINSNLSSDKRQLYIFTYDWRQDNVESARKLSHFIKTIQKKHNNPNLKVDLVAHSMGGLVSRYYLRYGEEDVLNDNDFPVNLDGAKNVRKVILLGTPNFGSVEAVHSFITGLKIGLRKIPTEVLVTMPSIYQLFPHSLNDWILDMNGQPLDRDIFDAEIWRRFQWSIFDPKVQQRIRSQYDNPLEAQNYIEKLILHFEKSIERARRFVWSLSVKVEKPPYKIIVMGGDCNLTPARLLIEEVNGVSVTRLKPSKIKNPRPGIDYDGLMLEPGDGTVTKASLLAKNVLDPTVKRHKYSFFPIDYPYFLCEDHSTLTSNINFQDNLLNILLSH